MRQRNKAYLSLRLLVVTCSAAAVIGIAVSALILSVKPDYEEAEQREYAALSREFSSIHLPPTYRLISSYQYGGLNPLATMKGQVPEEERIFRLGESRSTTSSSAKQLRDVLRRQGFTPQSSDARLYTARRGDWELDVGFSPSTDIAASEGSCPDEAWRAVFVSIRLSRAAHG